MRPSQLGTVTKTARLALRFLAWAGLVGAPATCPAGSPWGPAEAKKRRYLPLHCPHKEAPRHPGGRRRQAPAGAAKKQEKQEQLARQKEQQEQLARQRGQQGQAVRQEGHQDS